MKKRAMILFCILCLTLVLLPASALAGNGIAESPQAATAYMKIKFKCGCKTTGSGAMVCEDGLVTAGHNLICVTHNEPASSIEFYFGHKASNDYWYKYTGQFTIHCDCDFSGGYSSEGDIGVVKFPKAFGKNTGWYGSEFGPDSNYEGVKCLVCGYDANGKIKMFQSELNVMDRSRFTFSYKDLPSGMVGAAVYFLRGAGRNPALVGVYASNMKDSDAKIAVRMNREIYDAMNIK